VEVLRRARSGGSVEIGVLALFILFNFVSILSSLYLQHLSYSATALSFHLLYFDLFYLFSFHAHFICILVSLHFSVNIRSFYLFLLSPFTCVHFLSFNSFICFTSYLIEYSFLSHVRGTILFVSMPRT
jgi:hypothetical protein